MNKYIIYINLLCTEMINILKVMKLYYTFIILSEGTFPQNCIEFNFEERSIFRRIPLKQDFHFSS